MTERGTRRTRRAASASVEVGVQRPRDVDCWTLPAACRTGRDKRRNGPQGFFRFRRKRPHWTVPVCRMGAVAVAGDWRTKVGRCGQRLPVPLHADCSALGQRYGEHLRSSSGRLTQPRTHRLAGSVDLPLALDFLRPSCDRGRSRTAGTARERHSSPFSGLIIALPPRLIACVEIRVVRTSRWPSCSCTVRMSMPRSSKCVANEWRVTARRFGEPRLPHRQLHGFLHAALVQMMPPFHS